MQTQNKEFITDMCVKFIGRAVVEEMYNTTDHLREMIGQEAYDYSVDVIGVSAPIVELEMMVDDPNFDIEMQWIIEAVQEFQRRFYESMSHGIKCHREKMA